MPAQHEIRRVHTVAIGASAGGIEALRRLVASLPADFPAVVLVVLHLAPKGTSVLPQILGRAGTLRAVHATDGLQTDGGCIYVAPPDCHLIVEDGHVRLDRGPRTNGHRPAIDPLFRSAAAAYGSGVAGVVLSGVLDDGAAGLLAIRKAGGMTLVQDPDEALYDMMPRSAIEVVAPDVVGTAEQLGAALAAAASRPPADPPSFRVALREEQVIEVDRGASDDPQPGVPSGFSCPECSGVLWQVEDGPLTRFVCRTGHAYSPESFAGAQTERVEAALWTALRALEERSALFRRIAARHARNGSARTAERYAVRADGSVEHALVLREVLEQLNAADEEGAA